MITLGLSGLYTSEIDDYDPAIMYQHSHDAAACLVSDGVTVSAIEEERLSRDKHTFRFPFRAIRECLNTANITADQIDNVAFYFEEQYLDHGFSRLLADSPNRNNPPARTAISALMEHALDRPFDPQQVHFHPHHACHAASAYYDSSYAEALVLVSDGNAERDGVSVYHGRGQSLDLVANYSREHSLGHFYTAVTKMLGYRLFDEYKVMGLAAFGNPDPYLNLFSKHLELRPQGRYSLPYEQVFRTMIEQGLRPRRAEEPLTQGHKDLAAAAQRTLETVSHHILQYWAEQTGCQNLCIAGGVAQNTTLNGRILKSGTFASVYVPPAAHDAGAALGAAMLTQLDACRANDWCRPLRSTFTASPLLGKSIAEDGVLHAELSDWGSLIEFEEPGASLSHVVAEYLAEGAIVGWVQGRSEFGPRALGNRSILADPRPAENRDRVNRRIKEREDYRPFAPVVDASAADTYFDLTSVVADHRYMGFVVDVRPEHRYTLGATTHVDGSSRIQILHRDDNPQLWSLIHEFEQLTDVPVLLNTSFNNSSEPIVDSAYDAVSTLLTANLDVLVIGPFLVRSTAKPLTEKILNIGFELPPLVSLIHDVRAAGAAYRIGRPAFPNDYLAVSREVFRVLAEHRHPADIDASPSVTARLCDEICRLWSKRLIRPIIGNQVAGNICDGKVVAEQ
jgi:predicted NodU family carbamoyl transferase